MPDSVVRKSKPAARKPPASRAPAAVRALHECIAHIEPARAEALRGLFAAPRRWALGDGEALRFTPGIAPAADETFCVDAEGTRLRLRLETADAAQPQPSGLHWSDYRGRARLLAWSLAHEHALMRLSEALGSALLPQEAADDDAVGDDSVWLAFATEPQDTHPDALRGVMQVPLSWLPRLQNRAEPVYEDDPLPRLEAMRDLPVPVRVGFDGPALPLADWEGLRPGDVVLIGNGTLPPLQALATSLSWPLVAAPDGWRIAAAAQPRSSFLESCLMNDESPNDATADPGAEADAAGGDSIARNLPVQLAFDIGRIELSIGDLAALQPGYVFSLPAQLEGANVTIRANGRVAGRGEVVAVGDTLGVRVLAWD